MNFKKIISIALAVTILSSQSVFATSAYQMATKINASASTTSTFAITNGVELDNLELTHNGTYKERKLMKLSDSPSDPSAIAGTDGFISDVADYDLYLLSTDVKEITLTAKALRSGPNDTLKINGYDVERDTTNPKVTNKFNATTVTVANGDVVTVEITSGNDTSLYTINVKIPNSIEADPHIYGELTPRISENTSLVSVYAVNADVLSATITFDLTYVGTADTDAFQGFSKTDGTLFNNIAYELSSDADAFIDLDSDFSIGTLKSNGQFLSVTVISKNRNPVSIGATPRNILTVSLLNNANYEGTTVDMVSTIEVRPELDGNGSVLGNFGSVAYLDGYFEVRDRQGADAEADKATLSYITNANITHTIYMTINHDSNNTRVIYEMMTDKDAQVNGSVGYVVDRDVEYEFLGNGIYKMRISAKGYKALVTADIDLTGTPSESGVSFRTIKLLEGDIDGNNIIDAIDRSTLISSINQRVINSGDGFVIVGNNEVYSDYNDDDAINALDLGRLIKNTDLDYGNNISPRT